MKLASYQKEIVETIVKKKHNKVIICAATQSGKSKAIAIALILSALFNPGEEIINVSATYLQAKIIFDYVKQHLFDSPLIANEVINAKELNAQRIVFRNNSSIKILSAGGAAEGESLLGHSATTLIVDESGSIADNVFTQKIVRMLAAEKGRPKILVESGTPHRKGHFFESWNDPSYYKIHVDWKKAVSEGRLDYDYVMSERERMTEKEFDMWFNAKFVDEVDNVLIPFSWIEKAINKYDFANKEIGTKYLGVDVARGGGDLTVFTLVRHLGDIFIVEEPQYLDSANTMAIVGKLFDLCKKYNPDKIAIDVVGIGAGVYDRAKELNLPVFEFNAGSEAYDSKRFANLKSEVGVFLRKIFEEEKICLPKHKRLIEQLNSWTMDFTSSGKIRIKDPEKSPDFADSLLIAISCAILKGRTKVIISEDNRLLFG